MHSMAAQHHAATSQLQYLYQNGGMTGSAPSASNGNPLLQNSVSQATLSQLQAAGMHGMPAGLGQIGTDLFGYGGGVVGTPGGLQANANGLILQQLMAPSSQQQQQQQRLASVAAAAAAQQMDEEKIYTLILELTNYATREQALLELSKKREQYEDLAPILWHSFGVMSALLQEIVSVYPLLSPPALSAHASNRVCNALSLLQCIASHNETRGLLLNAHIPLYLYPFLNTTSKTRPFEYLRLTSLGVIGALVKNDSTEVVNFLLSTEIIPLCLRIMETGSELSKTVAIFIVQKMLLDDIGLQYICQTYERFYAVGTILSNMVNQLVETQAVRLLKHVVRCYLRLSDNPRAREALRQCLPEPLRDATFSQVLKDDLVTKRCLGQLLVNLSDNVV